MHLLNDILILFGVSSIVLFLCSSFRIPSIVGFLLTGIIIGPHGFALVKSIHEVEILAEIGVVLLLFAIGIEFSFKDLMRIKRAVLLGGSLQIVVTISVVYVIALFIINSQGMAIFYGFLMALSSTAIVLKLLHERAEIESPHGQNSLALLIFQDLIIVPMMLITPFLANSSANSEESLLILGLKVLGLLVFILIASRWLIPSLLDAVVKTRNRELFLLVLIVLCLLIALGTAKIGLSLALGAFLAGLIISESEFSHQALANILPFRDLFISFFFISIGMLLNILFVSQHITTISLLTLCVIVVKCIVIVFVSLLIGLPLRTAVITGVSLCQIGEFSFVLSQVGMEYELLSPRNYQLFLAVSIITMIVTPFIIGGANRIAEAIVRLPFPRKIKQGMKPFLEKRKTQDLNDHLVIVGFGLSGRNLARAARWSNIPYIIIEMNSETVKQEREKGEPIVFGDATNEAILEYARIQKARIVMVAISDILASRIVVSLIRRLNNTVHLIIRTRFVGEMDRLYDLGVDEVITEEFETSIEIFSRVLSNYLVPQQRIETFASEIRNDHYGVFRRLTKENVSFCDLNIYLQNMVVKAYPVLDTSSIQGKSLADLELRSKYGITVLAIHRKSQSISNPDGLVKLEAGDIIICLGMPNQLADLVTLFTDS